MTIVGYFGHASNGGIIAASLLAHGYLCKDARTRRAGFAVIIALILVGTSAAALKEIVYLPRPRVRTSSGFSSGHSSAAFGLAAVPAVAFPSASPVFYLLAVLTGRSRLYFRAHFTWDLIGGAIIGPAVGLIAGCKLIGPARALNWTLLGTLGRLLVSLIGGGVLIFFYAVERNV